MIPNPEHYTNDKASFLDKAIRMIRVRQAHGQDKMTIIQELSTEFSQETLFLAWVAATLANKV